MDEVALEQEVSIAVNATLSDATDLAQHRARVLIGSFATGWAEHTESVNAELGDDELAEIGRHAGAQAAASALWHRRVGETFGTQEVTELLGITRQALDSRKRTGSVLALPGTGTSHYPAWQFDFGDEVLGPTVRPVTLRIVTAFREMLDDVSPFTIAAWATSPQPELDERTPADWIVAGGDESPVVLAARRTAHLENQ